MRRVSPLVCVVAGIIASVAALGWALLFTGDPLDPFIPRSSATQLDVRPQGGELFRTITLRLDDVPLTEAAPVLAKAYSPSEGWVCIKSNDWRVVYERRTSRGVEEVRCFRVLARSGVNLEEHRFLSAREAMGYKLRKLFDGV